MCTHTFTGHTPNPTQWALLPHPLPCMHTYSIHKALQRLALHSYASERTHTHSFIIDVVDKPEQEVQFLWGETWTADIWPWDWGSGHYFSPTVSALLLFQLVYYTFLRHHARLLQENETIKAFLTHRNARKKTHKRHRGRKLHPDTGSNANVTKDSHALAYQTGKKFLID